MTKPRKIKTSELILDFDLYPRRDVDSQHTSYIAAAMEAGADIPPVVVDAISKRVVDGFHRIRAAERLNGTSATIAVIFKKYKNDAELFREAMRLNASHGRALTSYDRTHCALRAKPLNISIKDLATDLGMTIEKITILVEDRTSNAPDNFIEVELTNPPEKEKSKVGYMKSGKNKISVPLKNTIRHMSGKMLTKKQFKANEKLSGMNQSFYANQLILLFEADLIDWDNKKLIVQLKKLAEILNSELGKISK